MRFVICGFLFLTLIFIGCNQNKKSEVKPYGENNGIVTDSVHGYQPTSPIDFPHVLHMELDGMDCMTCHKNQGRDKASPELCVECHGAEDEKPEVKPNKEIKSIVSDSVEHFQLNDSILEFSHGLHIQLDGMECAMCHKSNSQRENISLGLCIECHEAKEIEK